MKYQSQYTRCGYGECENEYTCHVVGVHGGDDARKDRFIRCDEHANSTRINLLSEGFVDDQWKSVPFGQVVIEHRGLAAA